MRYTMMILAALSLIAPIANAQQTPPTTPPEQTEPSKPAPPPAPVCTSEFIKTYVYTYTQIQIVTSHVQQNENPPNIPEAVYACDVLEKNYPNITCSVPSAKANASTSDVSEICAAIRQYDLENNGPSEPPAAADVTLATPLMKIEPVRISLKVTNAAELQKAATTKNAYIVDGKVVGLKEFIEAKSKIGCVVKRPATITQGETLVLSAIMEAYKLKYRQTVFAVANSEAVFECTSKTGKGLTLGDLTKIFNGLAKVEYNKN